MYNGGRHATFNSPLALQVVECFRRLALASAIGIVNADSAVSPIMGILICLVFIHVFSTWTPYKTNSDNSLGIVLAYSLVLFFLAALLIKVDATSDDDSDQALFGVSLIVVILAGPIAITYQLVGNKLLVVHNAARKFLVPKKKKQQRKSATEVELAFRVANKAEEGVVSDDVIVLNGKAVAMAKICSCGNPFKGDSEFCRKCGSKRLTVEEAEIPSMAAPKETKALGEVPKAAEAKVRLAAATTAPRGLAPPRLPSSRCTPPPV